jgi:uncharacterized protein YrrD
MQLYPAKGVLPMEFETMELKKNASVYTSDQKEIGHVDRVVLDPKTKRISHIVVSKGLLFTETRVLPVNLIANATEDEVILKADTADVSDLPKFEETHYVRTAEIGGDANTVVTGGEGSYTKQVDQNIPEGSVALKEGAKVITEDGHTAGKVEQVLADPGTRQATHIVVSKGLLNKEQKLIPTFWIRLFGEEEIHLAAPANVLSKLQTYPA